MACSMRIRVYFAGRFNLVEREATRVAGAMLMWGISGRMRKKYGITGDVRQELFAAGDEWVAALGDRRYLCYP